MTAATKNDGRDESRSTFCSLVSRENGEDPIGTASAHVRYLLVEVPSPWEFQVENSKHFPAGLAEAVARTAADGKPCRLLAFASDKHAAPPGRRRVMYYERPDEPFAFFDRREYVVPEERLVALAETLIGGGGRPADFDGFAQRPEPGSRDLFVCTHGRHDRCCGKFGYPLYREIEERYASGSSGKLRVWRTSHFGGHRHAPTIIDFPEGRYWAQVRPEVLDALVLRQGDLTALARHYRGWGGVGPFEQAAERAAFMREGWDWIAFRKRATVLEKGDAFARVRFDYRSPDGAVAGSYEAHVCATAKVRTGGCGGEPGEARQFKVGELTHRRERS